MLGMGDTQADTCVLFSQVLSGFSLSCLKVILKSGHSQCKLLI